MNQTLNGINSTEFNNNFNINNKILVFSVVNATVGIAPKDMTVYPVTDLAASGQLVQVTI